MMSATQTLTPSHHCCHTTAAQDLAAAEEEAGEETGSSLRNVNQDLQRALGALGTAEAADAFRAGGYQCLIRRIRCCIVLFSF
jgi:hypothetical protein